MHHNFGLDLDSDYKDILSPNVGPTEFESKKWSDDIHPYVGTLFMEIWKLLHEIAKPKRVDYAPEKLTKQDKNEQYSVSLWNSFVLCFHHINSKHSHLYTK